MKLPSSKIYWADYLSYSALLTDKEICQVMKIIATRAMSYNNLSDNPQDNLSDNPSVYKLKQIQKLNSIQIDFYNCLEKAQDESARDYISKITNGRKGGRPKASKCYQVITNDSKSSNKTKENNYKYNGIVIKLNEKDYSCWKEKYPNIDLDYELDRIDVWFQEHKDNIPRWFFMTQNMLIKKQKEEKEKNDERLRNPFGRG